MSIDTPLCAPHGQATPAPQAAFAGRYQESKPRSAELLRMALAWMGQHDAAFNPTTFAVWYEHAAGINLQLSQAIEQCLQSKSGLADDTVRRLYREHIADSEACAAEQVSGGVRRVMQGLAESVNRTGESASAFNEKLVTLTRSLGTPDGRVSGRQVGEAVADTALMQSAMQALQAQLSTSQHEIERLRDDLQRSRLEAIRCPLTHVLNRNGFDQKLLSMLNMARESGQPACLVMIDIDYFKKVNDGFGHVIGDRVLAGLGEVLRLTATDPDAAVGRFGGEEFALLLPGCSLPRAVELAETVRTRAKGMRVKQRTSDRDACTITVSAGVAAWREGDAAAALVARADAALYRAKQAGRDRVVQAPIR